MGDRDLKIPDLPVRWQMTQPDVLYRTTEERLVSFGKTQIQMGILYDPIGKHLKAIDRGLVPAKGNTGLVPSEESGYDFKSKVLGKGGDRRFHGKIVEGVLHFPGKQTTH